MDIPTTIPTQHQPSTAILSQATADCHLSPTFLRHTTLQHLISTFRNPLLPNKGMLTKASTKALFTVKLTQVIYLAGSKVKNKLRQTQSRRTNHPHPSHHHKLSSRNQNQPFSATSSTSATTVTISYSPSPHLSTYSHTLPTNSPLQIGKTNSSYRPELAVLIEPSSPRCANCVCAQASNLGNTPANIPDSTPAPASLMRRLATHATRVGHRLRSRSRSRLNARSRTSSVTLRESPRPSTSHGKSSHKQGRHYCRVPNCDRAEGGERPFSRKDNRGTHEREVHGVLKQNAPK